MAFNHSGNCDCPVGDCDCGTAYVYYNSMLDELWVVYGSQHGFKEWVYIGEL